MEKLSVGPDSKDKQVDHQGTWELSELLKATNLEPPPGLLGGRLLRPGGVCLLAGPSYIGKTYLGLKLADAINSGKRFAGLDTTQAKVDILSQEMVAWEIRERLLEMELHSQKGITLHFRQKINIAYSGGMDALYYLVRENRPDILIVDALSDVYRHYSLDGLGNAARTVRDYIAEQLGCCVLFIHHMIKEDDGKSGINLVRGPKTLVDVCANVFLAENTIEGNKTFKYEKARHRERPETLRWNRVTTINKKVDIHFFNKDGRVE